MVFLTKNLITVGLMSFWIQNSKVEFKISKKKVLQLVWGEIFYYKRILFQILFLPSIIIVVTSTALLTTVVTYLKIIFLYENTQSVSNGPLQNSQFSWHSIFYKIIFYLHSHYFWYAGMTESFHVRMSLCVTGQKGANKSFTH